MDYNKLALLERVPLFAMLGDEELEHIARIVEEKDVDAGTVLTHEGRHEGYFYVIVSGRIAIQRAGQAINELSDGDFLGEISLLDGGPRTATATALTDTRLLVMTQHQFEQLMDQSPAIRRAVLEELGQRLRRLDSESVF